MIFNAEENYVMAKKCSVCVFNHGYFFSYEPELHPGVTYRIRDPKATLKIFSTGSITITAPSVANIQAAVERIYPLVHKFRKPKTVEDTKLGANVPLPPSASAKKRKRGAAGFSGGGNQSKRFNNHHSSRYGHQRTMLASFLLHSVNFP